MIGPISRRDVLKGAAATCVVAGLAALPSEAEARVSPAGWVSGSMTGARALVETLQSEGTACVFGIPGAQENELWDEMKARELPYLLVTHEFSASCMADGAARSTGRPGVICVVPGPGLTNSLSGIGEALLDSIPMVCIVGDVARGDKYKPFQVHELPQAGLLKQVTKAVFEVTQVSEIPCMVREAFRLAVAGEPGPVGVVIPYNLLMETARFHSPPLPPLPIPFDENAFRCALALLSDRRLRIGLYVGLGCMDHGDAVARLSEVLQAPVATSVSGKGVVDECCPLSVGWGYGPQGTRTAEHAFRAVDVVLAIGVRFSEVSTAFYSLPQHRYLIHVDANASNLGQAIKATQCVHADAGLFLAKLLQHQDEICRPQQSEVTRNIANWKAAERKENGKNYARCGVDPMLFLLALRQVTCADALIFVDVTVSEHWAAEAFTVRKPRTYFNPTDNQSMGWSIPAAVGAQRLHLGRQVATVTGDGCFLMSAMEISTAARAGLPVKFFVLDDQAYHYMQELQKAAYRRTTATILAKLDYASLAKGWGVAYHEVNAGCDLEASVRAAFDYAGPVLTRVVADYEKRPLRWLEAARGRFTKELSTQQKVRFAARLGARSLDIHPNND